VSRGEERHHPSDETGSVAYSGISTPNFTEPAVSLGRAERDSYGGDPESPEDATALPPPARAVPPREGRGRLSAPVPPEPSALESPPATTWSPGSPPRSKRDGASGTLPNRPANHGFKIPARPGRKYHTTRLTLILPLYLLSQDIEGEELDDKPKDHVGSNTASYPAYRILSSVPLQELAPGRLQRSAHPRYEGCVA
jgi:hypothetical protein